MRGLTKKTDPVLTCMVAALMVLLAGLVVAVLHFERRTRPPQECPKLAPAVAAAGVVVEPEAPSRLGDVDYPCKPDGSCSGPALACTKPELFWGIPMQADVARCLPKGSR